MKYIYNEQKELSFVFQPSWDTTQVISFHVLFAQIQLKLKFSPSEIVAMKVLTEL